MKYSQAQMGRVFVIRLEDGEILHEEIEQFCKEKDIEAGMVVVVGGADEGSKLVVGPENGEEFPVNPLHHIMDGVHEAAGTGTIFPDESGEPLVHIHLACGRQDSTQTGCIREGVKVWEVMEVILVELTSTTARRELEEKTDLKLLNP